jgi:hypothetical protein
LEVTIQSPDRGDEARLLSSFLSWLDRHFGKQLSSIKIEYRQVAAFRHHQVWKYEFPWAELGAPVPAVGGAMLVQIVKPQALKKHVPSPNSALISPNIKATCYKTAIS